MPNVMYKACYSECSSLIWIYHLSASILINTVGHARRQMVCAQRMSESTVFRTWIGQTSKTELSDSAEALECLGFHKSEGYWLLDTQCE